MGNMFSQLGLARGGGWTYLSLLQRNLLDRSFHLFYVCRNSAVFCLSQNKEPLVLARGETDFSCAKAPRRNIISRDRKGEIQTEERLFLGKLFKGEREDCVRHIASVYLPSLTLEQNSRGNSSNWSHFLSPLKKIQK